MYDVIIIGAGPAGISAGIYSVSRGKKTLILEKQAIGGLIGKVSTVTHYAGITEGETGKTFAERMKKQAMDAGVEFKMETVTEVELKGKTKTVTTERGVYQAEKVIIAAGTSPRMLGIPGEKELSGKGMTMNAARDCDTYAGKHVYVVGGSDGAVKEALYLSKSASQVTTVSYTHLTLPTICSV